MGTTLAARLMRRLEKGMILFSEPPKDCYKIVNLYVDKSTGKIVIKYDDGKS